MLPHYGSQHKGHQCKQVTLIIFVILIFIDILMNLNDELNAQSSLFLSQTICFDRSRNYGRILNDLLNSMKIAKCNSRANYHRQCCNLRTQHAESHGKTPYIFNLRKREKKSMRWGKTFSFAGRDKENDILYRQHKNNRYRVLLFFPAAMLSNSTLPGRTLSSHFHLSILAHFKTSRLC